VGIGLVFCLVDGLFAAASNQKEACENGCRDNAYACGEAGCASCKSPYCASCRETCGTSSCARCCGAYTPTQTAFHLGVDAPERAGFFARCFPDEVTSLVIFEGGVGTPWFGVFAYCAGVSANEDATRVGVAGGD
jgi:hypothetical protein